jgi:hypothetical protein
MTARIGRSPLLHFVVLGALLHGGARLLSPSEPAAMARTPIIFGEERIRQLAADYARETGTPPTPAQLEGLVEESVEEELLSGEARVARLDLGDRSVRLRLVQKMRALSDDPTLDEDQLVRAALTLGLDEDLVIRRLLAQKMRLLLAEDPHPSPPSDEELEGWLKTHAGDYTVPEAVSLTHLFLSTRRHGARLAAEAAAMAAWLRRANPLPARALARSDPFPLGSILPSRSRSALARQVGNAFADAVMALPVGRWSGPIASPFGLHLVYVDERRAAMVPPLDAVRRQVRLGLERSRATARLQAGLTAVRRRWDIRVDRAAIAATAAPDGARSAWVQKADGPGGSAAAGSRR